MWSTARPGQSNLLLRRCFCSKHAKPWQNAMSENDFNLMANILHSPSPINLEAAMTNYILGETKKFCPSSWSYKRFKSSAALVFDTDSTDANDNKLKVMVIGHADKIRMQVRSIGSDGKVFIDSDSFIPLTLLGNDVTIFSQNKDFSSFNRIEGGTVEAFGAIHFADPKLRSGEMGVKPESIYIELGIHGEDKKKQIIDGLGIKPGDSVLCQRRIKKSLGHHSFMGSHLDNGLGCATTFFLSRLIADQKLNDHVRMLFAYCTHEEIGRFGSRQLVSEYDPDVVIAVDVNHDYVAAPNANSKKYPEIEIGKGPSLSIGATCSVKLNNVIQKAAQELEINLQLDTVGRDSGTDSMAGVFACKDSAVASIGIPIRNMHTVSELGVTDDVLATVHLLHRTIDLLGNEYKESGSSMFTYSHPDLSGAKTFSVIPKE